MKYIIKLFPEIIVKSKSVRQHMIKILQSNIRNVFKRHGIELKIRTEWDKLVVRSVIEDGSEAPTPEVMSGLLTKIPGIQSVQEVKEYEFTDLQDIYDKAAPIYGSKLKGHTFCVRAKRKGQHSFTSVDIEQFVGGTLSDNFANAGVDLKNPEITVKLEIDNNDLFLITNVFKGLGGYPLSTQEDVLSLISGGYDSGVSSYLFIRRGSRVNYLFFNMGGAAHEIGVKQESYYLWEKYGCSHKVRFITVPFSEVVGEILTKTDHSVRGVILKRMMMRAGSLIAEKIGAKALITGESVGQVSSQTLSNLTAINMVSSTMILRPLIVMDKQDIIDFSRDIGTITFAENMPEYCGVISDRPTIKADPAFVSEQEKLMEPGIVESAVEHSKWMDIRDVPEDTKKMSGEIEITGMIQPNEVVIDVRAPDEVTNKPLVKPAEHMTIPFFKIPTEFPKLDRTKTYLLYCDNGVMSKNQAVYLKDEGFQNVKVYMPEQQESCVVRIGDFISLKK